MEEELQNTKGKKKLLYINLLLLLFITLAIVFLTLPVFKVTKIRIKGNVDYKKEDIIKKLKLDDNPNFFFCFFQNIKGKLEKDPYIRSAKVYFNFPNEINIEINEKLLIGYIEYMGTYIYIDENGQVLQTSSEYKEKLPIVKGLKFRKFKVGEKLEVSNVNDFNMILKVANMMRKYKIKEDSVTMDVNDLDNIKITIRKIDFLLGNLDNYDKKIRTMLEILEYRSVKDRGTVDMTGDNNKYIFKPLT